MIKGLIKKIFQEKGFAYASYWSLIATAIRVLSHLVINKILAIYIGPSGLGIFGQLRSFVMMTEQLSSLGINQGVTKYLASYSSPAQRIPLLKTALSISIIGGIIIGACLILFSISFSKLIFSDTSYATLLRTYGVTVTIYGLNMMFIAILYGYRGIKESSIVNITGSISSLLLTSILTVRWGLMGTLYATISFQVVVCVTSWFLCIKILPYPEKNLLKTLSFIFKIAFHKQYFWQLVTYSLLSITVITSSFHEIILRHILSEKLSMEAAGIWEALLRLILPFMVLLLMVFRSYYLPVIAGINTRKGLLKEWSKTTKNLLIILVPSFIGIYLLRHIIIDVLFSKEFYAVEIILPWYLIGELFRLLSWPISFLLIAKAKLTSYTLIELCGSIIYLTVTYFYINRFDVNGIGYIHLGTLFSSFIVYIIYFYFFLQSQQHETIE
ncbi:O-antigen translocase [Algivirga pacifica]|uniref:Lipid III flippase WzxE n=1 Tax=Algivirga pacifica TaxID=1162670 RepID=A0ABP9DB05_9BACT